MKCPFCGQEIDEGSVFCGYCGKKQPMVKYCIKCGHEIGLEDAFCGYCGASQNVEKQTTPIVNDEQNVQEELQKVDLLVADEQMPAPSVTEAKDETLIDEAVEHTTINNKEDNFSEQVFQGVNSDTDFNYNNKKNNVIKAIALFIILFMLLVPLAEYVYYQINANSKSSEVTDYEQTDSFIEEEPAKEEPIIPFTTKRVSFKDKEAQAETSVEIDFPVEGKEQLVESVRRFILETLVNTFTWGDQPMPSYTGDITNGQAIANFYGKEKMKRLREEIQGNGSDWQCVIDEVISICLKSETEKYISYEINFGGCHGGIPCDNTEGAVFLKSSGKRIEKIIKNPDDENFKKLLYKYVIAETDDIYCESSSEMPMPKSPPAISDRGVTFNYFRGEIAGMWVGGIAVTIPFDEIRDYLTTEVLEAI